MAILMGAAFAAGPYEDFSYSNYGLSGGANSASGNAVSSTPSTTTPAASSNKKSFSDTAVGAWVNDGREKLSDRTEYLKSEEGKKEKNAMAIGTAGGGAAGLAIGTTVAKNRATDKEDAEMDAYVNSWQCATSTGSVLATGGKQFVTPNTTNKFQTLRDEYISSRDQMNNQRNTITAK